MSDGKQNAARRAGGHEEEAGPAPRIRAVLGRVRRPGPLVAISVGYLVLVSGVMIWRGISVSPDYLLLILVPVAVLSGRLAAFARDWVPFVALFLGYEALRGVAPKLGIAPQVASMVHLEKAVFFGRVPSQVLQRHLGGIHPLVTAATIVYFCHFLFPIAAGLVLWLTSRAAFLRFAAALLAMSFAAFLIFLLLPTAPPWYAHDHGALPGVHDLVTGTLPSAVSPYYRWLNPNPVAAWPSLHAAYPALGALALYGVNRRSLLITLPWCCAVWFSVVFLGEHYAIDVLGGIALALATWTLTQRAAPHIPALNPVPTTPTPGHPATDGR